MASSVSSILAGIFDVKHYFHLQFVPHISTHHQYWRLLSHNLAFVNSTDLLLGIVILWYTGVLVERQFGSIKYASFAIIALLVGTLLEFLTLMVFHRAGVNHIAHGPALLIFSILYQYSRIVPSIYTYKIFGIPLNSNSLNYFLGLQLAISRPPASCLVAAIGILTGQLYRSDLAGLKSYRVSPSTVRIARTLLGPLLGSLRGPRRTNRALPDDGTTGHTPTSNTPNDEVISTARRPNAPSSGATLSSRSQTGTAAGSASVMRDWVNELRSESRSATRVRAPSEAEITQLTNMFPDLERTVVIGTLQRSPNIERAVETLLLSQR